MQLDVIFIIIIIICIQFSHNENFGIDSLYKSAAQFNPQSAQLRVFLNNLIKARDDFDWIRQACSSLQNNKKNSGNSIPRSVPENINSISPFSRNTSYHNLHNGDKLALSQSYTHLDNKSNNNIIIKNFRPILNPFHKQSNLMDRRNIPSQTNREKVLHPWNGYRKKYTSDLKNVSYKNHLFDLKYYNLPLKYTDQGQTDSNKVKFNVMNNQINSYNKYSRHNSATDSLINAPLMIDPQYAETNYRRPRRLAVLHREANDKYPLDYNLMHTRIKEYLPSESGRIGKGNDKYQDPNIKKEIQNIHPFHVQSRHAKKFEIIDNNNFNNGDHFVVNDIFSSEYKEEPKPHLKTSEKRKLNSLIADDNQEADNTSYEIFLGRQFHKKNNNNICPKVNENNYKDHKLLLNNYQRNQRNKIVTNSENNVGDFSNSDMDKATNHINDYLLSQNKQYQNLKNTKIDAHNKITSNANQKFKNPSLSMNDKVYILEPQSNKIVAKEKHKRKYYSLKNNNSDYPDLGLHLFDYNNNKKNQMKQKSTDKNKNPNKNEKVNKKQTKSNEEDARNDGEEVYYPEEIINLEKSDNSKQQVPSTLEKHLRKFKKIKKSEKDEVDLEYFEFPKTKNQKSLINNKNSITDNQNNKMHSYFDRKLNAQRDKYQSLNLIHSGIYNGLGQENKDKLNDDAKESQKKHKIYENDKKFEASPKVINYLKPLNMINSNTSKYSNSNSKYSKNKNKYYAITLKYFEPDRSLKQTLDFLSGNLKQLTNAENEEHNSPKYNIKNIDNFIQNSGKKWNALDSKDVNYKVLNTKHFLNNIYDTDFKQFSSNFNQKQYEYTNNYKSNFYNNNLSELNNENKKIKHAEHVQTSKKNPNTNYKKLLSVLNLEDPKINTEGALQANKLDKLNKFTKSLSNNLKSINYLKQTNYENNDTLREPAKRYKSHVLNLVHMNVKDKDDTKKQGESVEASIGNHTSYSKKPPDIFDCKYERKSCKDDEQTNKGDLNNTTRKEFSVSLMLHKDNVNTEYVKENKKFNFKATSKEGNFISKKRRKKRKEIKAAKDLDNKENIRDGDNYNDYLGTERFKSRDLKMYVDSINQLTTIVSAIASNPNDKNKCLAGSSQSNNTSTFKNVTKKSFENLERNVKKSITTETDKSLEKVLLNTKTISEFNTSLKRPSDIFTKDSTDKESVVNNQNTSTKMMLEHAKRSINVAQVAYLKNYDNRENLLNNYQPHFVTQSSRWHEPIFFKNTKNIRRRQDNNKRILQNISNNQLVGESVAETINNINVLSKTSTNFVDIVEDNAAETTFSTLLSTREKSDKTNNKTRQKGFQKNLSAKTNVNITSTLEEKDILESVHRKLANKLLSSVFSMVQSDADLRSYLGPGLYQKLDDKNYLKNKGLDAYKNLENINDIKHTEDMLKQVMTMLNKLVEEQVRIRTCSSPWVETSLFLQWMLHKNIQNQPEKYFEFGAMPLPQLTNNSTDPNSPKQEPYLFQAEDLEQVVSENNVSSADLKKKIKLIKQLIYEYDHLSDRDKIQVHNVKQYLYKHLDLLGKLFDNNNNLSNSKILTPDVTNFINETEKKERNRREEYYSLGNNRKRNRISHNKCNGKNIKKPKIKRKSNILRNLLPTHSISRQYSNYIELGGVIQTPTVSQYLMPSKVFESSINGDRIRIPRRGHRMNKPLFNDPNIIKNRKPNKETKKSKTQSSIFVKSSDEDTASQISEQYRKLVERAALYRKKREINTLLISGKSLNDIVSLFSDNEYKDLLNLPNMIKLPDMYRKKRDNKNNVYQNTHTVTDKTTSAPNV